jgi:1-acyl-sn-glycerol-3-phosphate acyltransferase
VWRLLLAAARVVCAVFCRLRVTGDVPGHLRGTAMIMASNHVGNFDPVVLVAAMYTRRMAPRILAAAGLFRAPVVGWVLHACGHIPVKRRSPTAAEALHEAEAALAARATVAMYPEGRIGLDPAMWPERGKTGLARLAMRTGATVIPVAQWGAHEVIAYGGAAEMLRTGVRSMFRRPVVRVHFGPPVDLSDLPASGAGVALQATERIMEAIHVALIPLRVDEPRLPRLIDVTRPVSVARVRRRARPRTDAGTGRAVATDSAARPDSSARPDSAARLGSGSLLAAHPQVGQDRLAGGAHPQQVPGLGDASVRGTQR